MDEYAKSRTLVYDRLEANAGTICGWVCDITEAELSEYSDNLFFDTCVVGIRGLERMDDVVRRCVNEWWSESGDVIVVDGDILIGYWVKMA